MTHAHALQASPVRRRVAADPLGRNVEPGQLAVDKATCIDCGYPVDWMLVRCLPCRRAADLHMDAMMRLLGERGEHA